VLSIEEVFISIGEGTLWGTKKAHSFIGMISNAIISISELKTEMEIAVAKL
jgi:hypothetical protein